MECLFLRHHGALAWFSAGRGGKARHRWQQLRSHRYEARAHGPLRALVIGEEWGQPYVSNFHEILTLYRQGGINFLGVFQNAAARIESKYGRETARLWKKAVAHTLYRGLPDSDTPREIEHRSGRISVMVRGFNVSTNQVSGSGDSLSEQSRPLLQVEDIRPATGGDKALLDSRDLGFYTVDLPNFWERPEMSGYLRSVREKPDKYAWLVGRALTPPPPSAPPQDAEILDILALLAKGDEIWQRLPIIAISGLVVLEVPPWPR